jgi:hydroxyacylglutathione hydrolase
MPKDITTFSLPLPLGMGRVNCYLIRTDPGYILIDTSSSSNRKALIKALESSDCQPGLLQLIVITHGDFDHTGNAAFLRKTYNAKVLMHKDDLGMVEDGDMFYNRKKPNFIFRTLIPLFSGFGKADRFTPDLLVEDGYDLAGYGIEARVVSIPGHSKGSIGILTSTGDLFCGDLLTNIDKPEFSSLNDDPPTANLSLQKLVSLRTQTVYPGHGEPFPLYRVEGTT